MPARREPGRGLSCMTDKDTIDELKRDLAAALNEIVVLRTAPSRKMTAQLREQVASLMVEVHRLRSELIEAQDKSYKRR